MSDSKLSYVRENKKHNIGHLKTKSEMYHDFWQKWLAYLQIQTRKWQCQKSNSKIKNIVLKEDEPLKRSSVRVVKIYPGNCVTVKTKLLKSVIKLEPANDVTDKKTNGTISLRTSSNPRGKRNKIFPIMSTLFLCIVISSSTKQGMVNVIYINNTNCLYFDKVSDLRFIQDQWKMVIFYDIEAYWRNVRISEDYVKFLNNVCDDDQSYLPIISQLEQEIGEIKRYNEMLHPISNRQSSLNLRSETSFPPGVLDDKFAVKYEKDINEHKQKGNVLFNNQISIFEADNNIIKVNEFIMNMQYVAINKTLMKWNLEKYFSGKTSHPFSLMSYFVQADNILSNLRRIQRTLVNNVTDIYRGCLDIHLLPYTQMKEKLKLIKTHLPEDVILPADNFQDMHGLTQIKARVTEKYLIIEAKLPLLSRDKFELDEIFGIPQKRGTQIICTTPKTQYLALNTKKDTVVPLTEADLQSCTKRHNDDLICHLKYPIYTMNISDSLCNMRMFIHNNNERYCHSEVKECVEHWNKLHNQNTWLFSCCECSFVRVLCKDRYKSKYLRGTGLLTLKQGCRLEGDQVLIRSNNNQDISNTNTSRMNEFINASLPKLIHIHNQKMGGNYIAIYVVLGGIILIWAISYIQRQRKIRKKSTNIRQVQPLNIPSSLISRTVDAATSPLPIPKITIQQTDVTHL